jgi:hypothetical protein
MFDSCSLSAASQQWSYIIPLIVIIVLSFVMRRRRPVEKTPVDIASSLFLEVTSNLKTVDEYATRSKPKKLKTDAWRRNQEKVDFLDESLRSSLANCFRLADDYNMRLESAKMYKSNSYIFGAGVDQMKEPLLKSKDGLEQWLKSNVQQAGPDAGRQGCMGGGFGG